MRHHHLKAVKLAVLLALLTANTASLAAPATSDRALSSDARANRAARYIVEAGSAAAAQVSVERVHGVVEQDLEIVHGVVAELNAAQAATLHATAGVRVYADRSLATSAATQAAAAAKVNTTSTNTMLVDGTGVATPIRNY